MGSVRLWLLWAALFGSDREVARTIHEQSVLIRQHEITESLKRFDAEYPNERQSSLRAHIQEGSLGWD